jgi:hypothetical protein
VIRLRFVVAAAAAAVAVVDVFGRVAFVLGTWRFVLASGLVGDLRCQGVVGFVGLVLKLIVRVGLGVVGVEEVVGRLLEKRGGIGLVNVERRVLMGDERERGVGGDPGIVDFDFVVGIEDLDSVEIEDSESAGIADSEVAIGNVDFEGMIVGNVVVEVVRDGY